MPDRRSIVESSETFRCLLVAMGVAFAISPTSAQNQQSILQADEATRQSSTAAIEQDGTNNEATGEFGGQSEVTLFTGDSVPIAPKNEGIFQKGRDASALIDQFGRDNSAAISQTDEVGGGADGATATIRQGNDSDEAVDSKAYLQQHGDRGTMRIVQQGAENQSYGIQTGNEDGSQTPSVQTHTIAGRSHRSEIIQRTSGAEADVTLSEGTKSTGLILQEQAGAKASINVKMGAGSVGELRQIGRGGNSGADIDIDGENNTAKAVQGGSGGSHQATVTQTGNQLEAELSQTREDDGAEGNVGTVNQKGAGNKASVEQSTGGGNSAQIAQEGETSKDLSARSVQQGGGGRNKSDIDQTGTFHVALIEQFGAGGGSVAGIDQSTDGTDENDAHIRQEIDAAGGTDTADIDQGGSANEAKIRQRRTSGSTGSNVTITQPGRRGDAIVDQNGAGLKAQIDLNGTANLARIEQHGEGPSAEAAITTGANTEGNDARIAQNSGGTIAAIDQTSARNTARVTQDNPNPANGTVEADIDQGSGVQNRAKIRQTGGGTSRSATITESGNENKATLEQSGAGDTIEATLQISGDFNEVNSQQAAESGNNLTASYKLQGDNNSLTYIQEGDNLGATVEQNGNDNSVEVRQTGSGYDATIVQNGDSNSFSITYRGPADGGGGYSVVQNGGE